MGQIGGSDVFTAQSTRNLMLVVSELETIIKKWAGPSAFPDDGRINERQLQKTVKKPGITEGLALIMHVVHRAARQLGGAAELESSVNQLREKNLCLLTEKVTDQKTVIDLQTRMLEKKT